MNTTIEKNSSSKKRSAFSTARLGLVIATLALGACQTPVSHPTPGASWTQRNGQVKFTSAGTNVVGDIVIRHDADNFLAEVTKGPGVPLLTISARFATGNARTLKERHMTVVKATGPLANGGWTWRPDSETKKNKPDYSKLSDPSKAWGALPEVFEWAQARAKGGDFRVLFPDVIMHSHSSGDFVERFDYRRVEFVPPPGNTEATIADVPPKDRKKLRVRETVSCRLAQ